MDTIWIATRTTHYEYPRPEGDAYEFDGEPVRVEQIFDTIADAEAYRDSWEKNYTTLLPNTFDYRLASTRTWEFVQYAPMPF